MKFAFEADSNLILDNERFFPAVDFLGVKAIHPVNVENFYSSCPTFTLEV